MEVKTRSKTMTEPRVLSASTLIGNAVVNPAGEDLGKIHDLMIDLEYGSIAYAVLTFGGFLGMGNKLFAIPWEAMELSPTDHQFILNVPQAKLEKAPGFDKDNWPDFADREWGTELHRYYGYGAYWEE